MTAPRTGASFFALILTLALAACTRTPAPTPTITPTTAVAPATATSTPVATQTPLTATAKAQATAAPANATVPAGSLPAGWQLETTEQLSIAIPPGWRAISLTGPNAVAAFDNLERNDPRLAGIIGGPEELQSAAFWAFGPDYGPDEFVDNLNVRRTPLGAGRVTDTQQVIDVLLPEYDKMGLKVTSTDATLSVNGLPAARVTYTMMLNTAGGTAIEVRGRQMIVATDSDLWVLSFSTVPEREGELASEFDASAQSFRPK